VIDSGVCHGSDRYCWRCVHCSHGGALSAVHRWLLAAFHDGVARRHRNPIQPHSQVSIPSQSSESVEPQRG
jgi:hypothetical protein